MFQAILSDMISDIDGAIGAMFLDSQGESVEIVGNGLSPYDLQVIGAYQGIFIDRIKNVCAGLGCGSPQRIKIDWEQSTLLCFVLPDGYFVVVVLAKGTNQGLAWRRFEACRDLLLREI